ncbi:MAG: hypothetical protein MUE51_13120 [Thermoleophilia bacterium]|nr:hypothetical protein [Thermoleophilia bacterium]
MAQALDPTDFDIVQNAATLLREQNQQAEAVDLLEAYTRRRPRDPQGFLVLGIFAADAGENLVARLALSRFLQLDPDNPDADAVRERLDQIVNPQTTTAGTTTAAPATTEAPATTTGPAAPATP